MTTFESVTVTAQATFGRDGAMFEGLLGFVAQLSVVLWSLVILTAAIRFVGMRIYRRGAARTAVVETAHLTAAMPTSATGTAPTPQAVVTTSVVVPRRVIRKPRPAPRSTAHVPAFAANGTEA
jgi:hypothetical protein